ncbi:MAG: HD domain-containing protein [Elusimicrobia bacterium]|nr:HD domain-containing protein [Elusimicrobiota bacterium]
MKKDKPVKNKQRRPDQELRLEQTLSRLFPDGYIVGGALRDHFLGRRFTDLDIAAPAKALTARGKTLAAELNASFFALDTENGVYRLTLKDCPLQLDLCAIQGPDISRDLARRDFAINATAYPLNAAGLSIIFSPNRGIILSGLKQPAVLDPFSGLKDLRAKRIALACPKAFTDDPLRMMRAFRMQAELGFELDPRIRPLIKKNARLIAKISGERIREEFLKILKPDGASERLGEMDSCGLLAALFPHAAHQKACAAAYYGKGGVLKHTFNALDRAEFLLANLKDAFPSFHASLKAEGLNEPLLKLAVFLHDIAKPATAKIMEGRLRFFGHESTGADMARELMERLRFSRDEIKFVSAVIREHMRPGNLAANSQVSDKAVYRFFRDLGNFAVPALLCCWADHASYMQVPELRRNLKRIQLAPKPIKPGSLPREGAVRTVRHLQVINQMLRLYFEERARILPEKILTGNDIMKEFKIPPGPEIGRLLELARLAQVQGLARDRKALLAYLKKNVKFKS